VPTTWSPTDKPAGVTLSSGNLVATLASTPIPIMFRATAGYSIGSGTFYFEAVFSASGASSSVGVANLSASVNTYLGGTVNEIAYGRKRADSLEQCVYWRPVDHRGVMGCQ
jgi:hypothetical protein